MSDPSVTKLRIRGFWYGVDKGSVVGFIIIAVMALSALLVIVDPLNIVQTSLGLTHEEICTISFDPLIEETICVTDVDLIPYTDEATRVFAIIVYAFLSVAIGSFVSILYLMKVKKDYVRDLADAEVLKLNDPEPKA